MLAMGAVLIAVRQPLPTMGVLRDVPPLAWAGGAIATIYILAVVILVPRIGVGMSAVLIIAGQIAGALLLDHLGAFGAPRIAFSGLRALGLTAVVTGAALVRIG